MVLDHVNDGNHVSLRSVEYFLNFETLDQNRITVCFDLHWKYIMGRFLRVLDPQQHSHGTLRHKRGKTRQIDKISGFFFNSLLGEENWKFTAQNRQQRPT
jgi:hypothetical protein